MVEGSGQLQIRDLRQSHHWGRQVYELTGREAGDLREVTVWGQVLHCHERGPTWGDRNLEYEVDYRDRGGRTGRVICRGSTLTRTAG